MNAERKITVMLPDDLLGRAMESTGEGITPTLRKGLELLAAAGAYKQLVGFKGQVKLRLDLNASRKDR